MCPVNESRQGSVDTPQRQCQWRDQLAQLGSQQQWAHPARCQAQAVLRRRGNVDRTSLIEALKSCGRCVHAAYHRISDGGRMHNTRSFVQSMNARPHCTPPPVLVCPKILARGPVCKK
jgi:hypothetical protein